MPPQHQVYSETNLLYNAFFSRSIAARDFPKTFLRARRGRDKVHLALGLEQHIVDLARLVRLQTVYQILHAAENIVEVGIPWEAHGEAAQIGKGDRLGIRQVDAPDAREHTVTARRPHEGEQCLRRQRFLLTERELRAQRGRLRLDARDARAAGRQRVGPLKELTVFADEPIILRRDDARRRRALPHRDNDGVGQSAVDRRLLHIGQLFKNGLRGAVFVEQEKVILDLDARGRDDLLARVARVAAHRDTLHLEKNGQRRDDRAGDEQDAQELRQERSNMQIIFQDPFASLNPRMTVYQTIREPMDIAGGFSKEEIDRLKELANEPRTEYQKQLLSLNGKKAALQSDVDLMQQQIMVLTQNQSDAKVDQLKSQDMLKAGDAAEEIQKAASDEIVGMVIADAKEKLDKELEEKKAEAEKKAEEKEEQDERIEKAKEERKEDREMIEGDLDAEKLQADASFQKQSVTQSEETTQRINQIMKKNHLINEDLKGIEIDVNF